MDSKPEELCIVMQQGWLLDEAVGWGRHGSERCQESEWLGGALDSHVLGKDAPGRKRQGVPCEKWQFIDCQTAK